MVKDDLHEGRLVTDGRNWFRVRNGQRHWISQPPDDLRRELLFEAARLRLLKTISESARSVLP